MITRALQSTAMAPTNGQHFPLLSDKKKKKSLSLSLQCHNPRQITWAQKYTLSITDIYVKTLLYPSSCAISFFSKERRKVVAIFFHKSAATITESNPIAQVWVKVINLTLCRLLVLLATPSTESCNDYVKKCGCNVAYNLLLQDKRIWQFSSPWN